jgi:hypothetical protein
MRVKKLRDARGFLLLGFVFFFAVTNMCKKVISCLFVCLHLTFCLYRYVFCSFVVLFVLIWVDIVMLYCLLIYSKTAEEDAKVNELVKQFGDPQVLSLNNELWSEQFNRHRLFASISYFTVWIHCFNPFTNFFTFLNQLQNPKGIRWLDVGIHMKTRTSKQVFLSS